MIRSQTFLPSIGFFGSVGARELRDRRQQVDRAERPLRDGARFDLAGVSHDARAARAAIEAGTFRFAIRRLARVIAVRRPGPLSEVKITSVLSSTPADFSAFMISPTDQSISIITSPYRPCSGFALELVAAEQRHMRHRMRNVQQERIRSCSAG